jgi:chromosome segregation ATPase
MNKTANQGRSILLVPTGDCSLQLIMIVFATAGLAWLRIWSTLQADTDPLRALSRQEVERRILDTSEKNSTLAATIDQRSADATRLDRELREAGMGRPDIPAAPAELQEQAGRLEELRRDRQSLQQQLQELVQKTRQLEREQRDLQRQQADLARQERELEQHRRQMRQDQERLEHMQKQLAELDRQLQELEAAKTRIREQIAAARQKLLPVPNVSVEAQPRIQADSNLTPVAFMVHQGTVTPVAEPHYKFLRAGDGAVLAWKVSAGETADQALAEGSAFLQALAKIDRQKGFAAFLVDKASFETFRAVRDELRRRQVLTGWEPTEFPNLRLVAAGGASLKPMP